MLDEIVGLLELSVEKTQRGRRTQMGKLWLWSHLLRVLAQTPFRSDDYDGLHGPRRISRRGSKRRTTFFCHMEILPKSPRNWLDLVLEKTIGNSLYRDKIVIWRVLNHGFFHHWWAMI